jgi:hypothetical protein
VHTVLNITCRSCYAVCTVHNLISPYLIVYILCTFPNITSDIFIISIYLTNFTCTQLYIHQTLVNLLHVSAWHRCLHHGVLSVANALKDSLIMAPMPCQNM